MNRRQLGLGVATAAMTLGSAARAQQVFVQRGPEATAFYNSFNDQIARLPQEQQGDVRAFYEANGWRPVWNAERLRALNAVAARGERHGLAPGDFFDFVGLAADPGVGSVVIVVMQPGLVGRGSLCFAGVGLGVGPFGGEGAVEAFDLSVGLWPIRLCPLVLHAVAERVRERV